MSDFLHLEYGHILDYEPAEPLKFSDDWCNSIVDSKRQKESQLARLLLNKICQKIIQKSITEALFKKDISGRPYFEKYPDLYISITHSHGHVWTAIASSPIGIDFEKIDPSFKNDLKIAFDDSDWKLLVGDTEQIYKYFSLKESYSKMTGTGFTLEPSEIKISSLQHKTFINIFENKSSSFIFTLIAQNFEPSIYLNLNQYLQELPYE
jgi:phosphopantetheinyl transferase